MKAGRDAQGGLVALSELQCLRHSEKEGKRGNPFAVIGCVIITLPQGGIEHGLDTGMPCFHLRNSCNDVRRKACNPIQISRASLNVIDVNATGSPADLHLWGRRSAMPF